MYNTAVVSVYVLVVVHTMVVVMPILVDLSRCPFSHTHTLRRAVRVQAHNTFLAFRWWIMNLLFFCTYNTCTSICNVVLVEWDEVILHATCRSVPLKLCRYYLWNEVESECGSVCV